MCKNKYAVFSINIADSQPLNIIGITVLIIASAVNLPAIPLIVLIDLVIGIIVILPFVRALTIYKKGKKKNKMASLDL